MDSHTVTAFTPFRFLDLPQELRDDIYETAIFDLSPPDMFMKFQGPDSLRLRKMNTDVLLMSRQVYREARDVIVRRGRLILVSISFRDFETEDLEMLSATLSGIFGINPMYRNLCIMSHRIDIPRWPREGDAFPQLEDESDEPDVDWEFILHRNDIDFFCHFLMGEFDYDLEEEFVLRATHTLDLHCSPIYGQHEFGNVYAMQTLVLQEYRNILRGFKRFKIRGCSTGWENGLYGAVLQDIRSIDDKKPTDLIDAIRNLEDGGSQVFLQTGDVETANVFWVRALSICRLADVSLLISGLPDEDVFRMVSWPRNFKSYIARWEKLRRQNGNECAAPLLELWFKLTSHRLSGALRFIEQGHHLATRHGHAPRPRDDYLKFLRHCYFELAAIKNYCLEDVWWPQPSDEAQLCLAAAAIGRLLDATDEASRAYSAVHRAVELAPDDESSQQETERVETWIRRLVDNGTLEHFPSSESSTRPWWCELWREDFIQADEVDEVDEADG